MIGIEKHSRGIYEIYPMTLVYYHELIKIETFGLKIIMIECNLNLE